MGIVTFYDGDSFVGFYFGPPATSTKELRDRSEPQPFDAELVSITHGSGVESGRWASLGRHSQDVESWEIPEFIDRQGSTLEFLVRVEPRRYGWYVSRRRRPVDDDDRRRDGFGFCPPAYIELKLSDRFGIVRTELDPVPSPRGPTFDNDDALDFVNDLAASRDGDFLATTLRAALDARYLELPEAAAAVAAAEVVAAAAGLPAADLPSEVVGWVVQHGPGLPEGLTQHASDAIERIERDSELRDLWYESGAPHEWLTAIADLRRRLSAALAV